MSNFPKKQIENSFELCGEVFEIKHFPHLYKMFCTNNVHTEQTLKSIADTYHEGCIVSAAQAFESDLAHG